MPQNDNGTGGNAELHDLADRAKLEQIVRRSIAQSLPAHFAPLEELPPRPRALLERGQHLTGRGFGKDLSAQANRPLRRLPRTAASR